MSIPDGLALHGRHVPDTRIVRATMHVLPVRRYRLLNWNYLTGIICLFIGDAKLKFIFSYFQLLFESL